MGKPWQATPEAEAVRVLRQRLEPLSALLGYPRVWLHPVYNAQYHSVSIVCWGGTIEQQQALMTKLAEPLSPEFKTGNKGACHEYPDSRNPQINFNDVEDALRWIRIFDGIGARVVAAERGWGRG